VASQVAGHERLRIEVHSEIPVARGLGSSAALAAAAAAAAGAADPFSYGVAVDGHPENAAASAFGGLVAAAMVGDRPVCRRLPLDPGFRFVVVIPDRLLSTESSRAALPEQVTHADAVFNLGRMALLIAGLADQREMIPEAGDDRLHQEWRAALFPEAGPILAGLREAGAATSCWSGAGPSLLAICTEETAGPVAGAAEVLLETHHLAGEVRTLEADRRGITASGALAK
jgi:homoserine kinase